MNNKAYNFSDALIEEYIGQQKLTEEDTESRDIFSEPAILTMDLYDAIDYGHGRIKPYVSSKLVDHEEGTVREHIDRIIKEFDDIIDNDQLSRLSISIEQATYDFETGEYFSEDEPKNIFYMLQIVKPGDFYWHQPNILGHYCDFDKEYFQVYALIKKAYRDRELANAEYKRSKPETRE